MSETVKYVYLRENTLQSIVQDLSTLGITVLAFWLNYTFIGGNDALDLLLFVLFFVMACGRAAAFSNNTKAKIESTDD